MNTACPTSAEETHSTLASRLLSLFNPERPWTGRLSDSAVATSVAIFALQSVDANRHRNAIERGCHWLVHHQNADGGWGDSPDSPSNLTATLLTWCALGTVMPASNALVAAEAWLIRHVGVLTPAAIVAGVRARYGGDRTFSAPILALAALAGRMGPLPAAWEQVPQLPFELALLPNGLFRWLKLGVVSYALPALIAVGLVRHRHGPSPWFAARLLRDRFEDRLLSIAARMQPLNGGYEEATPLTAFVTLFLAAAGRRDHPVVARGVRFLMASQRQDGGWPIDTDLATWLTVHAVLALGTRETHALTLAQRQAIHRWLLAQQHTAQHPLTFGAPGGWGWTDLPGAMPDADDTAGVLLALRRLGAPDAETRRAAEQGVRWLLELQNRDGGIPTFARGWGRLPFDRSCPDITAHTLHAFLAWLDDMPPPLQARMKRSLQRVFRYLSESQSPEGTWTPLWFGTQATTDEANLAYGTARTVRSLQDAHALGFRGAQNMLERGRAWLLKTQNADGGWGPQPGLPSGIEETSLAVSALAAGPARDPVIRGAQWLSGATKRGRHTPPAPIGLYFARLWYAEELYPLIFATAALTDVLDGCQQFALAAVTRRTTRRSSLQT
jgi:squalene-hopene/tetraprenyl-beta-curcumene cyclase